MLARAGSRRASRQKLKPSIWDILYGTWRPSQRGPFQFGLEDGAHREYDSLAKLYYLPLLKIAHGLKRRRTGEAIPQIAI